VGDRTEWENFEHVEDSVGYVFSENSGENWLVRTFRDILLIATIFVASLSLSIGLGGR